MRPISNLLLSILVGALLILMPWGFSNQFVQPENGQLFILLLFVPILAIFILVKLLKPQNSIRFSITKADVALFILILIIAAQMIFQRHPMNSQILELISFSVLYLFLRFLRKKNTILILGALLITGITQAIYGNLQLYSVYPSHHGLFKMTGSFFNPGPYAGYLISIVPIAITLYMFDYSSLINSSNNSNSTLNTPISNNHYDAQLIPTAMFNKNHALLLLNKYRSEALQYLAVVTIILILLVLPASKSRAAWIAVISATTFILYKIWFRGTNSYVNNIKKRITATLKSRFLKTAAFLVTIIILASAIFALYNFKKGSADGRLLIWKISTNIIKDKPLFGHGSNGFQANYMDYQAKYFSKNTTSIETSVADNTKYAFNEFIKISTETGILGLTLCTILLSFLLFGKTQDLSMKEKIELIALRASLFSLIIFSMFSYPFTIVPIKTNLIVFLALISNYLAPAKKVNFVVRININPNKIIKNLNVLIVIGAFIVGISIFSLNTIKIYQSNKNWKMAFTTYQMGAYDICIKDYEKAFPYLKYNGDFLLNYGKALSMAEKHEKAIEILEYAKAYYPNTVLQTALGDSYKALGQFNKAEETYLDAWHMIPSRFYPKYLLAKLYNETGQNEKAIITANELLTKEIKVESQAIKEIKQEMRSILTSKE